MTFSLQVFRLSKSGEFFSFILGLYSLPKVPVSDLQYLIYKLSSPVFWVERELVLMVFKTYLAPTYFIRERDAPLTMRKAANTDMTFWYYLPLIEPTHSGGPCYTFFKENFGIFYSKGLKKRARKGPESIPQKREGSLHARIFSIRKKYGSHFPSLDWIP